MGKKKKRDTQTSKGTGRAVNSWVTKAVRRDRTPLESILNKQQAWLKGHNPWITVPNPNTSDTRVPFIRKRASEIWGDPRRRYRMGSGEGDS